MGPDQHVDAPTHKHGNTLDLIITNLSLHLVFVKLHTVTIFRTTKWSMLSLQLIKIKLAVLRPKKDLLTTSILKERFTIDVGNIKQPEEITDSKVAFFEKRFCYLE